MPSEVDEVQHLKNLLLQRIRANDAKAREIQQERRELEAWAKTLGELQDVLPNILAGERIEAPAPEQEEERGRIPITELIDRYLAEGHGECSAADIKKYIAAQGYPVTNATYNSAHENLTKRVKRGEMVKDGPRFKVKGE